MAENLGYSTNFDGKCFRFGRKFEQDNLLRMKAPLTLEMRTTFARGHLGKVKVNRGQSLRSLYLFKYSRWVVV